MGNPSSSAPPSRSLPSLRRRRLWLAGAGALAVALAVGIHLRQPRIDRERTYTIFYGRDIPFHFQGDDGQPAGLAYELVAEAARRAHLKLRWAPASKGYQQELFVLQTIRPEVRATHHFTEPYLQAKSCFVVPAESALRRVEDLRRARISHVNYAIHRDNLTRLLPAAQTVPTLNSREALETVARGEADAAFLNEYSLLPNLLSSELRRPMRIIPSGAPTSWMAISSTHELAAVADAIRDQMHSMVEDGTISALIEKWGWFPNLTTDMVRDLVTAQRRAHRIQAGLAGLCLILAASVWLALRSRNQTIRLHQVRQELQERDAWIRTLMEQAGDGIEVFDARGQCLAVNGTTLRRLGYTEEQMRALGILDLDPGMTGERYDRLFGSPTDTPATTFESVRRRGDGTTFPVEVTFSRVEHAGERRALLLVRDSTERKQAEARLSESEARFRALVEKAPEAIVVLEPEEERILDANSKACDLFRLRREELLHTNFPALSPPQQPDGRSSKVEMRSWISRAVAGESVHFEWTHWNADRREIPCEVYLTLLPSTGRPMLRGSIIDISARLLLEEQFRQAQKMEAIGQLAGGVAHDFNNILAAVLLQLNLLQINPRLDAETQQALREVETQAKRAVNLIRQLLMFSRRSVLAIQRLDLNEVIANLLTMLGRLIGEHITLAFERGRELPAVRADRGMLEQVLMNLVVNARDAMPKGGRLTLATQAIEITPEQAGLSPSRRPGRFVRLAVTDTGAGIEPAILPRLFEPFFTTKEIGKGTGLGLATVDGIVAQHQGWIEVGSVPGAGSTFTVFLPATPEAVVATPEPDLPAIPQGRETLLLVEDEAEVRAVLSRSLRHLGYQVREAADGLEALAIWQERPDAIDLVFTDIVMPGGISGLELMERLRRDRPALKVIVASGHTTEISQIDPAADRSFTYLTKPFDTVVLAQTVRACLDRR